MDKKLITLIFRGYSGSNLSPIIDEWRNDRYRDYEIKVIYDGKIYSDFANLKINRFVFYKKILEKYKYVMRSKLMITTYGSYRLGNDSIMLNLWHGMPIKSMPLVNKSKDYGTGFIKDGYF